MNAIPVLLLEDNDADADLLMLQLRKSENRFEFHRAISQPEFLQTVEKVRPALIISDYSLPSFDGLSALKLAREKLPDVPFIFVSGTIGEDRAVEALRNGAADYVLKDRMARLVPAVDRALRDAKEASLHSRARQELLATQARYESVVDVSPDAIIIASDGVIAFANKAALQLYRAQSWEQLLGRKYLDLLHQDSLGLATSRFRCMQEMAEYQPLIEEKHVRLDGTEVYLEITSAPIQFNDKNSFVSIARDISERKRYETALLHQATHDGLTNLPNRTVLSDRLHQAIRSANRHSRKLALGFVDLDNFKSVNDSFGHDAGDRVLIDVASRLRGLVRETDTVARLGGDEFIVLFVDLDDPMIVSNMMYRLLETIAQPILVEGHEIVLTASAGISVYPLDAPDADIMLRNADTAMYLAKQKGRNTFEFFTPDMSMRSKEKLLLATSLRHALERQQLCLYYQPQFDIQSGKMNGAEALIRWNHPEKGLIPPGEFVPLLEDTGLIVPVGQWIIRSACNYMKRLDIGAQDLVLSINLSAQQFNQADLVDFVEQTLKAAHLPPERIEFELTESMVAQNPDAAVRTTIALKSIGVSVAIDDFGTGYSSLSYLKRFPLDRLKIDRSFVSGIVTDANDAAICRTVIALAHSLGLRVVAEGVETGAQLDFLREHGCDEAQGYLLGRPMSEKDFKKRLRQVSRY